MNANQRERDMNFTEDFSANAIQVFEPDPGAIYTIDIAAELGHVSRRTILLYCRQGLISPFVDPERGGYYFNDEAIRLLRRIDYLHNVCGINLVGTKLILDLTNKVKRLEVEARFPRRRSAWPARSASVDALVG